MGLEELRRIRENRDKPKEKKVYKIPAKSAKKIAKEAEQKKEQSVEGKENALDLWFESRRAEMTGKCMFCRGKTEKNNDATYRHSIHHFLDKRPSMFPSVALHPSNFWELCFYGNSCHTNVHNSIITWELLADSNEWALIVDKFIKVYPSIAEEERRNIPELLLKEL